MADEQQDRRDETRRDTDRLFGQNKDQYNKIYANQVAIADLRSDFEALKVDLIGVTGTNGLRGEFRRFQHESQIADEKIMETLSSMREKQDANLKWTIGLIVGVPSLIFALDRMVGIF